MQHEYKRLSIKLHQNQIVLYRRSLKKKDKLSNLLPVSNRGLLARGVFVLVNKFKEFTCLLETTHTKQV
jgi:hypothetical protein